MKSISLRQYILRKVPEESYKVLLQPSNYNIDFCFRQQDGIETILRIKGITEYRYSLIGKRGWLHAVDDEGQKKEVPSVFYIQSLKEGSLPINNRNGERGRRIRKKTKNG